MNTAHVVPLVVLAAFSFTAAAQNPGAGELDQPIESTALPFF